MRYIADGTPLVLLVGKEYGTGSSRDWAAKGTALLGVKAVIAESYERIHRGNLVGMGVLPLAYEPGVTRQSLGLTGRETIAIHGIASGLEPGGRVQVSAKDEQTGKDHQLRCRGAPQLAGGARVSQARRHPAARAARVRSSREVVPCPEERSGRCAGSASAACSWRTRRGRPPTVSAAPTLWPPVA
jgi:aconitate hydratase